MPRRTIPPRRGIAMLLVLLSLAMATILTTSYLASRDNSGAIGANVVASAGARSAAQSGLDLGIAILQTQCEWRTMHTNGLMLAGQPFGGTLVDVEVIDLETMLPPTADTNEVRVTAFAVFDGIAQTAMADVSVKGAGAGPPTVNVDLSEFAVFGTGVTLDGEATIMRWPSAPASAVGKRIAFGTVSTNAGAIALNGNAAAIDATVFHGPGASDVLVLNGNGPEIQRVELPGLLPMPDAPLPPVEPPLGGQHALQENNSTTISGDVRVDRFRLVSNGTLGTITGDTTIVIENDLDLNPNTGLVVDGNLTLVVFGSIDLRDRAYIELTPGSTLTIYADGPVSLNNAYIGNERVDQSVRDNTGAASWMDTERIRMFGTGTSADAWALEGNSVVKGTLYLPGSPASVTATSAIYGRISSDTLVMRDDGSLFYDHALDSGLGFTNPDSLAFDADGNLIDAIANLTSLDDAALLALAEALGFVVEATGATYGTAHSVGFETLPGAATPRTVTLDCEYKTFGMDMADWEGATVAKARHTVQELDGVEGLPTK